MSFQPHLVGYPRLGPGRELKWALEHRWAGKLDREQFESRITELRAAHLAEQHRLAGVAADDYFLYDAAVETAMMYGLIPDWARDGDAFETLTRLTRGTPDHEAWEMTKWFDTNYHYVVPEIDAPPAGFRPLPWREPQPGATWVVVGPYSLLKLSKVSADATTAAAALGRALWDWVRQQAAADPAFSVQVDEPSLGMVLDAADRSLLEAAYAETKSLGLASPLLVSVQFGQADPETAAFLGERGAAVQLPPGELATLRSTPAWKVQPEFLLGVLDGRSVWPDDYQHAAATLAEVDFGGRPVRLTTSTSLMFLPYTTDGEDLPPGYQFAREKAGALRSWAQALNGGPTPPAPAIAVPEFPEVGSLRPRVARAERRAAQAKLDLPLFPTTTTGSLPQTAEVRKLRADLRAGIIDLAAYHRGVDDLIRQAISWQEAVGLDVLVHGEFERTDMVEYFGARMEGFLTTRNGWVLSYGSRAVRPPIIAAPPTIHEPITVREWQVAQEATDKPVKGMLTGPVTIVNWSFRPPEVPDDRLFWAVAEPIAREVRFLVEAGALVVQIDEPAVRERWPLPTRDASRLREVYARGVRAALNRVFDAPSHVQMHTHMCYGDFGDIVPLWSDAGVDVASIEFSRSKDDSYIHQFYELFGDGHLQIGPGVFDVHSPHTPGAGTMGDRVDHFLSFMDAGDLWVNPDCGLKTRRWEEIERQVSDMVAAARSRRTARGHD